MMSLFRLLWWKRFCHTTRKREMVLLHEFNQGRSKQYDSVELYYSNLHFLVGNSKWYCRIYRKERTTTTIGMAYGKNKFEAYRKALKDLFTIELIKGPYSVNTAVSGKYNPPYVKLENGRARVNIADIERMQEFRSAIESVKLNQIDWIDNYGNILPVKPKMLEWFMYTGLNNVDYITTGCYLQDAPKVEYINNGRKDN